MIKDIGSSGGTFLNRSRLSAPKCASSEKPLAMGDEIRLGTSIDESCVIVPEIHSDLHVISFFFFFSFFLNLRKTTFFFQKRFQVN